MDRTDVSDSWIGMKVVFIPLNDSGRSMMELRGWLRDVTDEGIEFAKAHYVESVKKETPETSQFYPWSHVGHVEPFSSQDE